MLQKIGPYKHLKSPVTELDMTVEMMPRQDIKYMKLIVKKTIQHMRKPKSRPGKFKLMLVALHLVKCMSTV